MHEGDTVAYVYIFLEIAVYRLPSNATIQNKTSEDFAHLLCHVLTDLLSAHMNPLLAWMLLWICWQKHGVKIVILSQTGLPHLLDILMTPRVIWIVFFFSCFYYTLVHHYHMSSLC